MVTNSSEARYYNNRCTDNNYLKYFCATNTAVIGRLCELFTLLYTYISFNYCTLFEYIGLNLSYYTFPPLYYVIIMHEVCVPQIYYFVVRDEPLPIGTEYYTNI